jgi:hypothetical protein
MKSYVCLILLNQSTLAVAIPLQANVRGCSRPHIISQCYNLSVTPCPGRDCSPWPGSAQCFELTQVIGLNIPHNRSGWRLPCLHGELLCSIRSDIIPTSIWKINLVENNTLGWVVALSIWQCYCIIKSAAAVNASMNLLSLNLSNQVESHTNPNNGFRDWTFGGCLG